MLSNEYRLSHCRFCLNRKTHPRFGVVCSLKPLPTFENQKCPKYLLDESEKNTIDNLYQEAKFEDDKKFTINYINWAYTIITLIMVILGYLQYNKLNENYRWTLGTTYKISTSSFLNTRLTDTKYLHYKYYVNGIHYDAKSEVDFDIVDSKAAGKKYFVKFQTDDPKNSQIIDLKMAPYYVSETSFPINGIASDSLKIYMKTKLEEHKRKYQRK